MRQEKGKKEIEISKVGVPLFANNRLIYTRYLKDYQKILKDDKHFQQSGKITIKKRKELSYSLKTLFFKIIIIPFIVQKNLRVHIYNENFKTPKKEN